MDIEETVERLKLLARGELNCGRASLASIDAVLGQTGVAELVQAVLLRRMGFSDELVAFLKRLPQRPASDRPLAATELAPRLVEGLADQEIFTVGELARALRLGLAGIRGVGPVFHRDCQLVVDKYLPNPIALGTKRDRAVTAKAARSGPEPARSR